MRGGWPSILGSLQPAAAALLLLMSLPKNDRRAATLDSLGKVMAACGGVQLCKHGSLLARTGAILYYISLDVHC